MTTPTTTIRGFAQGYYGVFAGTREVARATSHGNAIARARGVEAQLATAPAICLCCAKVFKAAGRFNRLCRACKERG